MSNYSSVIIDFDGTLFDTRRAISATLYETFAAYNVPPPSPERVEAVIGRGPVIMTGSHMNTLVVTATGGRRSRAGC
jgi:phosphoglycolate phosphatase-like HAD superfamily hydrolase